MDSPLIERVASRQDDAGGHRSDGFSLFEMMLKEIRPRGMFGVLALARSTGKLYLFLLRGVFDRICTTSPLGDVKG
jgi:hypothetical protein